MKKDRIFWVVKDKEGFLVDYYASCIYDTRRDLRDNTNLVKGEKAVKVKLVEVEQ